MRDKMKHKREFFCCETAFTGAQIKEHLKEKHGITEFKGNRSLDLALDGEGFYSNTFTWTIGGVKITEVSSGPA